jgi:mannitol-1-phosphate 5-dehydrogenase
VEAFNHILIERVRFDTAPREAAYRRGIQVFEEKEDLQPFEEAKLYGHNAVHALAAYIGAFLGIERIADLRHLPAVMCLLRSALLDESGGALLHKYAGIDPYFTPEEYARDADTLLERMVNPYLQDTVARVGRDPQRKLGWNDRLVGAIRLAMAADIKPRRYAMGVAAALTLIDASPSPARLLPPIWRGDEPDPDEVSEVLHHIENGCRRLNHWHDAGCLQLEALTYGNEYAN